MKEKKRILVVDDDSSIHQWLVHVLHAEGYEIAAASRKDEAFQTCSTQRIDLVLLDLNLPGDNAWEIFGELVSYDPFLPVIITGRPDQFELACLVGAGAMMEKPLDTRLLLQTIRDLEDEGLDQRLKRLVGTGDPMRFVPSLGQYYPT